MPATESTWRSLKLMHIVFGVASVAMLITTVWMLAADHNRSWKQYQREFRDIETWTANARIDEQETADYNLTEKQLKADLLEIQSDALSDQGRALFAKFVEEAKRKTAAEDDVQAAADAEAARFIEQDVDRLSKYTDATQRRELRMDLYNRMLDFIARVRFREDNLARNLKFRKAALDKATADYSLAVGEGKTGDEVAPLQLHADELKTEVEGLTKLRDAEKLHREALEGILRQLTSDQDKAEKALKGSPKQTRRAGKSAQAAGRESRQAALGAADSRCLQQPAEGRPTLAAESYTE